MGIVMEKLATIHNNRILNFAARKYSKTANILQMKTLEYNFLLTILRNSLDEDYDGDEDNNYNMPTFIN
jgi:hypothetical protein